MCTDALVSVRHGRRLALRRSVARLGVFALAVLALTAALAPVASARDISRKESRAAVVAAERVERDMRKHGSLDSSVLGCWHKGAAADCAAIVKGDDGNVRWRCFVQIRLHPRGSGFRAKLVDVICVVEGLSRAEPEED
jgi:hypothetical protein